MTRRQRWIALACALLLVLISFTVVAIIDGVTHPQSGEASPPPRIERTQPP
ncbi:MAG: hypothetical protein WBW04_20530 [Nitrolancea sp.]